MVRCVFCILCVFIAYPFDRQKIEKTDRQENSNERYIQTSHFKYLYSELVCLRCLGALIRNNNSFNENVIWKIKRVSTAHCKTTSKNHRLLIHLDVESFLLTWLLDMYAPQKVSYPHKNTWIITMFFIQIYVKRESLFNSSQCPECYKKLLPDIISLTKVTVATQMSHQLNLSFISTLLLFKC